MRTSALQPISTAQALWLSGGLACHADITITYSPTAKFTHATDCPAADGKNILNPDPVEYLNPPQAGQGVLAELANTANTKFSGWIFKSGPALNGILTIDYYHSHFYGSHISGGTIKATYEPARDDPANIRWIQMAEAPNLEENPLEAF